MNWMQNKFSFVIASNVEIIQNFANSWNDDSRCSHAFRDTRREQ